MAAIAPFPTTALMTPQEAADFLRTGVRTLERWRHAGGAPAT